MAAPSDGRLGRIVNAVEEGFIAFLFAAMTFVTFSQVVARYVFNSGWVWALELTVYLFAWLVLFGMSYGVKVHAHLGVDAFVKLFSNRVQRVLGLVVVAAGLAYGTILLIGSWDYVAKLYKIGIEAEDLPIPQWVPMMILPIGVALLMYRFLEIGVRIWRGQQLSLLGDEARQTIEEVLGQGQTGALAEGVPPGTAPRMPEAPPR